MYREKVRPHLEYEVTIWHPYKMKNMEKVEHIQRRATRLMPDRPGLSYRERLRKLNLPSLRYRKIQVDMVEAFKIIHRIYDSKVAQMNL